MGSVRDGGFANAKESADEIFDAEGLYASAGFIDSHCHGARGADFSDADLHGLIKMCEQKVSEGVTTFLPTTLTLSSSDLKKILATAREYAALPENEKFCRVTSVHLEGPFINPKMLGAQNPAFVRKCDASEIEQLREIVPVGKITFAPEIDESGGNFVEAMVKSGVTPSAGHTAATYEEFKFQYDKGLRCITHFCNQVSPLHHRQIGVMGAGLLHDDVYIELIADRIHVSDMMLKLIFAKKDLSHIVLITDAMRASGMPDGAYTLGGLDVKVENGAARLASNGALAGSVLRINDAVRNVRNVAGITLPQAVACASSNVAASLGLKDAGTLEVGGRADIAIFDSDVKIKRTYVGGILKFKA